jgi:hypothetical protein
MTLNSRGTLNTAAGAFALYSNSRGHRNTADGYEALARNTTGTDNTAAGYQAPYANITGSHNIAVGDGAGALLTSGDNNIYLGSEGADTESDTLRLGLGQTSTFIAGIANTQLSAGSAVLIDGNGQLGALLSSARYKRDIEAMGQSSRGLYQLRPVTFTYKQDAQGRRQYGLIAEEVAQVYPELVVRGAKGEVETVQYHELIPMLLNEGQHQQQALEAQARQVAELRAQNARLQAAVLRHQARQEEQRAQDAAVAARLQRLEARTRTATVASR